MLTDSDATSAEHMDDIIDDDSCEQKQIDHVLQHTSTDVGRSAATSQGIYTCMPCMALHA